MKKAFVLIFSLLAFSAAYSAQVAWGVGKNNLPGFPGTVTEANPWGDIEGALVFLVQGSNVSDTLAQVTASADAANTFIDSYSTNESWTSTLNENGQRPVIIADDASAGTYFAIIFSADKKYALASDAKDLVAYIETDGGTTDQLFTSFTEFGEEWTAVTVPEPTVLALLALGVAGLALKRKNV